MKANELRIGNYVELKGYKGKITVFNNDKLVIKCKSAIEKGLITDCEPILLDEKWLVKFGFDTERNPEEVIYTKRFDVLDIYKIEIKRKVGYDIFYFKTDDLLKQVLKVHQLQNLYYALTGEELTIKTK